jgi:hypothetical protein
LIRKIGGAEEAAAAPSRPVLFVVDAHLMDGAHHLSPPKPPIAMKKAES